MRQRCLDDVERCIDVCFHRGIKILVAHIQDRKSGLLPTRVVDHDVEPAQLLHRLSDQPLTKSPITKISWDCIPLSACIFDELNDLSGISFFCW